MSTHDILYLSAYLSSRCDNHKKTHIPNNNFDYIKNYYGSIIENNLNAVIFVDNSTDIFIDKYQNKNITFIKQKDIIDEIPYNHIIQPHDLRFILFYYFIKTNISKYKYFVMTDISDVIIIKDVKVLLKNFQNNILFVGKENEKILENQWFSVYFDRINHMFDFLYDKNIFQEKLILNCGIIAGNSKIILQLLESMISKMKDIYGLCLVEKIKPIDMFLINYIIYSNFESYLYDGNDLHTKFGHYQYDDSKYIMHK